MFERQLDQPLFPKMLWNRPISRSAAGRLLIVGGHQHGVAKLQSVYQIATAAGIGRLTMLVPDVLRPMLGMVPDIDFGASTVSGSLAKLAVGQLDELASQADGVLLGPDSSNNSETMIAGEGFINQYNRPLILTDDGLELITLAPDQICNRPKTLVILSMQELFRLAGKLELPLRVNPEAGLVAKLEIIQDFYKLVKTDLAVVGAEIIIKSGPKTSVTELPSQPPQLLAVAAGILSVSYVQNPGSAYQGLTTGAYLTRAAITGTAGLTIDQIGSNLAKVIDQQADSV